MLCFVYAVAIYALTSCGVHAFKMILMKKIFCIDLMPSELCPLCTGCSSDMNLQVASTAFFSSSSSSFFQFLFCFYKRSKVIVFLAFEISMWQVSQS